MTDIELKNTETELKKRWVLLYTWGRKQNDVWDGHSKFIYEIKEWDILRQKISEVANDKKIDTTEFINYSSNHWYNFHSALAVEDIFIGIKDIIPAQNLKNRLVDFNFFGINFDHKTSVFPLQFENNLQFAIRHPEKLIEWFYKNQSIEQRQHFSNRLFLVVYDNNGSHWKLKAELGRLKSIIKNYAADFNIKQLKSFEFAPGKTTFSDIIWAIK